jgi:hypothetical protein
MGELARELAAGRRRGGRVCEREVGGPPTRGERGQRGSAARRLRPLAGSGAGEVGGADPRRPGAARCLRQCTGCFRDQSTHWRAAEAFRWFHFRIIPRFLYKPRVC